jgi:ribonuclease P/MRP protein subunit RPP40
VDPLAKHFPTIVECAWQASQYLNVALPQLQPPAVSSSGVNDDFSDYVGELYEWLSLVSLESPRVLIGDDIDSFLSQYVPPVGDDGDFTSINVVRLTWEGFMAAKWAHEVFIAVLLTTPSEMWLSFVVSAFSSTGPEDCKDCTILKCPGSTGEYILWEVDQR